MAEQQLYIGLMSGTSADSIDAALADLTNTPTLIAHHSLAIDDLREEIIALATPGDNEIQRLNQLDRELGLRFAQATSELLINSGYNPRDIQAIGSHGQTLRHEPPTDNLNGHPYTLQAGDPNTIAQQTGITTVADFRRRDIAAGGQGAPLAPAFHLAAFEKPGTLRAIINIGGMANISCLPGDGTVIGFDTGPGNALMDGWINRHQGESYDNNGQWAASGATNPELLKQLLAEPYLQLPPPKSTGRELFNLEWLDQQLTAFAEIPPEYIQATLLEFTAQTIADAVRAQSPQPNEIYICGGGAYNTTLMQRLETLLHPALITNTGHLGIAPEWVEAVAFAWLAKQTLENLPGNAPSVTGAGEGVILGGVYPA